MHFCYARQCQLKKKQQQQKLTYVWKHQENLALTMNEAYMEACR